MPSEASLGNIMAMYKLANDNVNQTQSFAVTERPIYGSSHSDASLGVDKTKEELLGVPPPFPFSKSGRLGNKQYELSNHLGNVLVVISDKKIAGTTSTTITGYKADVRSAQDYYAFGSMMKGRSFNSTASRYGAGGHEKIDEVSGNGNTVDMGDRWLDVRLGRTPKPDAKSAKYPNLSPYSYAANNPIYYIDPDGKDVEVYVTATKVGTTKINLYSADEIKKDASFANKTEIVAVYEVQVKNESGSTATFYFTRTGYRGQTDGTKQDVTFDVRNDKDEFLGQVKSRWGGTDNVLELRDKDDINDQSVEGMKGDVEWSSLQKVDELFSFIIYHSSFCDCITFVMHKATSWQCINWHRRKPEYNFF